MNFEDVFKMDNLEHKQPCEDELCLYSEYDEILIGQFIGGDEPHVFIQDDGDHSLNAETWISISSLYKQLLEDEAKLHKVDIVDLVGVYEILVGYLASTSARMASIEKVFEVHQISEFIWQNCIAPRARRD